MPLTMGFGDRCFSTGTSACIYGKKRPRMNSKLCYSTIVLSVYGLLLAAAFSEGAVLHINKLSIPTLEPLRPSSSYVIEYGPLYSPNSSEPETSLVYTTPPSTLVDMPVTADLPPLPVKHALTKYVVSIAPSPKLYPRKNYFVISSPSAPKTVAVDRLSTTQAQIRWTATNVTSSSSAASADDAGATASLENRIVYSVSFRQLPVDRTIAGAAYKTLPPVPNEIITLEDTFHLQAMAKDLLPGATYVANVSAVLLDADRLRIVSEPAAVVWAMEPEPPSSLRESALRTNESSVTITWKPPSTPSLVSYYLIKLTGVNGFERTVHVPVTSASADDMVGGGGTVIAAFKSNNPISNIVNPYHQALSYTFNDLQPGTSYNISVQTAVERKSMPGASVQLSAPVSVQVTTVPEPPASLTRIVTPSSNNDSTNNRKQDGNVNALTLRWSPPRTGNADGYVVNVRPPLTNAQSVTVDQLGRTARILGIQPGAVYRVDVQSHSGPQLKQRFSKPLSQTIASGPAPPESVWFIPGATTPTSVTIAWTASRGTANVNNVKDAVGGLENAGDGSVLMPLIDYYEVRVNSTPTTAIPSGWKSTIVRSGGDGGAQTAVVNDLLPAHTYQVEVIAVSRPSTPPNEADIDHRQQKSEPASDSGLEKSLPTSITVRTKPLKPQELAVETLNITSVRLSWRAEVDEVHGGPRRDILYQISVARAASPQNIISSYRYQPRALAGGTRASVNLSPLESSMQYVFEVRTIYADDLISEPVTIEGGPALNMDVQLAVSNRIPPGAAAGSGAASQPYVTLVIKKLPSGIMRGNSKPPVTGVDNEATAGISGEHQPNDVPLVVEYSSVDAGEHGVVNITRISPLSDGAGDKVTKEQRQKDARDGSSGANGSASGLPSAVIGPLTPGAQYKFRVRNVLTGKDLYAAEEVMPPNEPAGLKVNFDETFENGTSSATISWQAPMAAHVSSADETHNSGVFDRFYLMYATRDTPAERMIGEYIGKTSASKVETSTTTSATPDESTVSTLATTTVADMLPSASQSEKQLTNLMPGTTYNVRVYTESRGRRSASYAELIFTASPMPPERFRLVAVENEKIVVEWKAPARGGSNISHYILEVVNLNFSVSVAPQQQPQSQQSGDGQAAGGDSRSADGTRLMMSAHSPAPMVMAGMPPSPRQMAKRTRPMGRSSSLDLPMLFFKQPFGGEPTGATSVVAAAAGGSLIHAKNPDHNNLLRARRSYLNGRFGSAAAVAHTPVVISQPQQHHHQQHEHDDSNGLDLPLRTSYGSSASGGDFISPRFLPAFTERMARVAGGGGGGGERTLIPLTNFNSGSKLSHGQSKRQERWNVSAGSGAGSGVFQRTLPIMPGSALCCKGAVYSLSIRSVVRASGGAGGMTEKESHPVILNVQSLPPSVTVPQSNVQVLNTTAMEIHFKLTYPPQLSLFDAVEFRLNSSSSSSTVSANGPNSQTLPLLSRVFTFATLLMPEPIRAQYLPLENPVTLVGLVPGETYSLDGWTLAGSTTADAAARSPVSTPVSGITLKPAPVSSLAVSQRTATSVTVTWDPPVIFSIYHYYELVCNGTPSVVTLPKSRHSYDIVGLRPWTRYSITVVAVSIANGNNNNNGNGGGGAMGNDLIGGAEEKVAAAAGLLLNERGNSASQDERIVAGVMSAAAGIGGQRSEPTTIFVQTAETTPGPLRSVNSRLLGPRQLQLEWAAPDAPNGDLQYYAVEYRGLQHDAARRKKLFNATTHDAVLDDLEPGEPYQVQVYATTRAGAGDTFVINVAPMPVWNPPLTQIASESKPHPRKIGMHTIEVAFSRAMFNETYGDVVAYTIIVTELASADEAANSENSVEHRNALYESNGNGVEPSWADVHNLAVWPTYQVTAFFNPFRSFDSASMTASVIDSGLAARTAASNDSAAGADLRQKRAVADDISGVPLSNFANQTSNNDAVSTKRTSSASSTVATFVVGSDNSCLPATSVAAMSAQQSARTVRDVSSVVGSAPVARSRRAATDSDAATVITGTITNKDGGVFSPRLLTTPSIASARRRNDRSAADNYLGGRSSYRERQQQLHALDAVAVVQRNDDDEAALMMGGAPARPTQLLRQARLNGALIHSNDSMDLLVPPSLIFGGGAAWPHNSNNKDSAASMVLKARLSDGIAPLFTGESSADGGFAAPAVTAGLPALGSSSASVVGTEYCNGPLKPNTEYAVRVRAFTSLQPPLKYTDSKPLIVSTLPVTSPNSYLLTILLPVAAAIALAVLLIVLGLLVRQRRFGPCFAVKRARRAQARAVDDKLSITESLQERTRPVRVDQFPEHVRLMSADSDFRFSEEYDELKIVGKEQSSTAADLPCNRPKNRFTNILPYDHSRVKLQPTDDEEGTDYVNASYMPGYNSPREFIVAQGPLHSTRDDFWRMIWEQNSLVIVMLTRCIEKGREKCDHYWPYDTEPVMYGDIQVTILNELQTPDWTIREFRVCQGDVVRSIRHFHFTAWPDFGVPEHAQVLVQFIRAFRERISDDVHPIACHCSAGVGRSGTFIVLDRILQQLEKAKRMRAGEAGQAKDAADAENFPAPSYGTAATAGQRDALSTFGSDCYIDIYGIVHEMRRERCSMVQTEQQYVYIHHCVLCVLEGREDVIDDPDEYGGSNAARYNSGNMMMMTATLPTPEQNARHHSLRYPAAMNVAGYHQSLPRGFNNTAAAAAAYNLPHLQHQQSNNSYYDNTLHRQQAAAQRFDSPSSSRQRYYTQQGRGNSSSTLPYNHRLAGGGGGGAASAAYAGSVGNVAALLQQQHRQQEQHHHQQRMGGAEPMNLGGAGGGGIAADNMGYDDDEGIAESGPF